jgi:hypothetical protein
MPTYKNTDETASKVKVDADNAHFKTVQPGDTVTLPREHGENLGWEKVKDAENNSKDNGEDSEEVEGQTGAQDNGQGKADTDGQGTGDEGTEGSSNEEGQEEVEEDNEFESWSEALLNLNVEESTDAIDQALEQSEEDSQELLEDALEAEEDGQDRKSVKSYIEGKLNEFEQEE